MSVFICYRRDDAQDAAGRLLASLRLALGRDCVFMDITGIDIGADFRVEIDRALTSCTALLAVIGNQWLIAADGSRRLDDSADFVRLEIAGALARGLAVIPVLVRDAKMPRAADLPGDMEQLAWRNAVELRHSRWDDDVAALAKALKRQIAGQSTGSASTPDDAPERAPAAPTDRHRSPPGDRGRTKRRAASKEPLPSQASEPTEAWKLAAAAQLESVLIDSVGPLGRVILRRELARVASPNALYLALESHLPDAADRTTLRRAIEAASTPGAEARQPAAPPPSVPPRAEPVQRSPASLPAPPASIAAAAHVRGGAVAIQRAKLPWRAIGVALPVIALGAFLAWKWGGLGPTPRPEPEPAAAVNVQPTPAKPADEPTPAASAGSGGINAGAGAGANAEATAEATAPARRSPAPRVAAAHGVPDTPIPEPTKSVPAPLPGASSSDRANAAKSPIPAAGAPPPVPAPSSPASVAAPAPAPVAATDRTPPAASAPVPTTSRSEVAVAGPEAPASASLPAAPTLVKVPYVVCATETQARKALTDIGLKVEVEYVSALGNGGCGSPSHVLSQTPMSGKAEIATVVRLRVRQ